MEKTIKKPVEEKPTVGEADRRIMPFSAWCLECCELHGSTPSS